MINSYQCYKCRGLEVLNPTLPAPLYIILTLLCLSKEIKSSKVPFHFYRSLTFQQIIVSLSQALAFRAMR